MRPPLSSVNPGAKWARVRIGNHHQYTQGEPYAFAPERGIRREVSCPYHAAIGRSGTAVRGNAAARPNAVVDAAYGSCSSSACAHQLPASDCGSAEVVSRIDPAFAVPKPKRSDDPVVARGQDAWERLQEDAPRRRALSRGPGDNARARREQSQNKHRRWWREVGEALTVGKCATRTDHEYYAWLNANGFGDMPRASRRDAVWFAAHIDSTRILPDGMASPGTSRQWLNKQAAHSFPRRPVSDTRAPASGALDFASEQTPVEQVGRATSPAKKTSDQAQEIQCIADSLRAIAVLIERGADHLREAALAIERLHIQCADR